MRLIDKLQSGGSTLTSYNGNTTPVNPLATQQSKMHDSYSITGDNSSDVNSSYQGYLDGTVNLLPTPSRLDLGGTPPSVSPTGQPLPYNTNQPS